ncbi:MAG: hypothetical protein M1825_001542 [Sarcosagium campestre]|nr:MAG: hypothetical protein M1825_001542 [Sarcosagium campestre]
MSLLPDEVNAAMAQLLSSLSVSDNITRTKAEERLNKEWVQERPDVLLMALVEQIQRAEDPSTRSFAAVLFRKIATKNHKNPASNESKELFTLLQPAQKEPIRTNLVQALTNETLPHVRNKIGDAVAEIARQYSDEGEQWPELLEVLFQTSQSPDAGQREAAFRIFATTPGIIERQHEDTVLAVFVKGFKDEGAVNASAGTARSSGDVFFVRIAAMEAFASFFRSITKKAQQKYHGLIPELLNVLPPIKQSQDSEQLSKALIALIDLAEVAPKMFRDQFHDLVTFSITVIQDKDLEDQPRQNALELMATFADYAPQMCRKDSVYTGEMVTQCLSLMTDIGDDDDDDATEWNNSDDLDVEDSDKNHVAGEQCMDRLANKLGGGTLLQPTFGWLPRMMESASWRDRHAALMAISAISEGCREQMVDELPKVLTIVVPALRDPHPRIRWAGCNALGQMSTDFAGTMQEKYHELVLSSIIPVLESPEPRVQAHAAAALVNFCEEAEKAILEPYLDSLLDHLFLLLASPKRFVQEQALSTIATIADSAEGAFGRYYDRLMPVLFAVLRGDQSKEFRLLRAKAMECATLIALAVGKEKLGQDALALVQVLGTIQNNITDPDDPQSSYLMHCWGRMCRVLGQDFTPYLPGVMPQLIELAASAADIQLLDDEEKVAEVEQEDGWELLPVKGKVIGIRTSALDDKHMAIELIVVYAQVLEAAFDPYVAEILEKISLPSLTFFFHDPVRVAAAKSIPQLLNSSKKAHGEQSQQVAALWDQTADKILEVLNAEPNIETLAEMYQCFYESVEVLGKNRLSAHQMAVFVEGAKAVLDEYQERVKDRLEERNETEEGEEDSEELLYAIDDDQTLLSDMNKAFHTIFKNQGVSFLPHWERLMPFYNAFIANADATQRQWALCIFDDVLEFCGEHSWTYSRHIVQPLVDGLRDVVPSNRQAAAYGVGVAAHKGGPAWSDFVAASIPTLFQVTQMREARLDDHVFATENACASIAKILHYNSSKVANVQEVVTHWIDTFPIVNDEEAAPYAYSFLAQLIDQQNPAVISQATKCFVFIAQALEAETVQGLTATRVTAAAKVLLATAKVDAEQILNTLPPQTQQTIKTYFG